MRGKQCKVEIQIPISSLLFKYALSTVASVVCILNGKSLVCRIARVIVQEAVVISRDQIRPQARGPVRSYRISWLLHQVNDRTSRLARRSDSSVLYVPMFSVLYIDICAHSCTLVYTRVFLSMYYTESVIQQYVIEE